MIDPATTTHITTRVFKSGNSQAVRIPKEFQLDVKEVEIFSRDGELVIRPKRKNLLEVFDILDGFSDDFMKDGREDLPPQERDFDA
jgi:antitoxin VapB